MKMIRRLTSKTGRRRLNRTPPTRRWQFEGLEPRAMLAVSPLLWANEGQVSISFAPDGTEIAGQPSKLFETFGGIETQAVWQTAILRAFQTWSDHIAVDFGITKDSGDPLGISGSRVGDDRFGDVRIGAIDMSGDIAAVAISDAAALSGTWTGDIVFNSQANFQTVDNIYAVALHEVGHLLGLTHSESPASVMHEHGNLSPLELSSEDIETAIRINGQRLADQYDTPINNDSLRDATILSPVENGFDTGATPIIVFADLHDNRDVDHFEIDGQIRTRHENGRPIDYRGPMTVHLQTSGISLLSPSLTLFDKNGNELGLARSSTVGGATLSLQIDNVDPQEDYFIRVAPSGSTPDFSIGGYSLTVTFDELLHIPSDDLSELATHRNRDLTQETIHQLLAESGHDLAPGQNDSIPRAERLVARPEFEFETYFQEYGTISHESPSDFYRFSTPNLRGDSAVLTTFVRSLEAGQLIPRVQIYDVQQTVIETQILANGGGEMILQAELQANTNYFVEVTYSDPLFAEGNYSINLSFGHESVELDTFFSTELEIGTSVQSQLFIGKTQLFHFALDLESEQGDDLATMSIVDEAGVTVHQLSGRSGEIRSSSALLLIPGTYQTFFDTNGESEIASISLVGLALSDPFVVEPEDAIDEPEFACPDSDEIYCYPGEIRSTEPYLWDDFIATLDDPFNTIDKIPTIIGEWWEWYWQEQVENGPVLGGSDAYDATTGQTLSIEATHGVLGNDFDPEAGSFIAVLTQEPQHGSVQLDSDGGFRYVADEGFAGVDIFTYVAHDFISNSDEITVSLSVTRNAGDVDGNGIVDEQDIDRLCESIHSDDPTFDINRDGQVTLADVDYLVDNVLDTTFGDSNLDGQFNSTDLIVVFSAGLYESESGVRAGWRAGDWNCDGVFDSADLISVFTQGNYEFSATAAATDIALRILSDDDDLVDRREK